MIKDKLSDHGAKELGRKHHEKVKGVEEKLTRLIDLCIDNGIDMKAYTDAKERYESIREELKANEVELMDIKKTMELYEKGIPKISSLGKQYEQSDLTDKRKIIGSIFPKNFEFENQKVRTIDLNPIILKITSINKGLGEKIKKGQIKKN